MLPIIFVFVMDLSQLPCDIFTMHILESRTIFMMKISFQIYEQDGLGNKVTAHNNCADSFSLEGYQDSTRKIACRCFKRIYILLITI